MAMRQDLLATLRDELAFLDRGGYRDTQSKGWRPKFVFQDSPTCPNFAATRERVPCSECILMQLVPQDKRDCKVPCRHIPLNGRGETIDSLYRSGTPEELERTFRQWLVAMIERLEKQADAGCAQSAGGSG